MWFPPVLLLGVSALVLAQPPKKDDDPPPIIIKPNRPGDPTPGTKDPPDKIIIRPMGTSTPKVDPAPVKEANPQPGAVQPAPRADGMIYDYWFVAAVDGQIIGYTHWDAKEEIKNGRKLITGTKYQKFTVSRIGNTVSQFGEEATVETTEGEVLVTSFRQGLGNQSLSITGVVDGKVLKVTGSGPAAGATDTPWPAGVVGVAREPALFKQNKVKPGESFDYFSYIAPINRVVKITVTFEGEESLVLWPSTPPKKLNKYVARMEPLPQLQFPPNTTWVDPDTGEPLLVEFKYAALGGRITFLRTTQQAATQPITRPLELFNAQAIRLDREIPLVHQRGSVIYKVAMPDDDTPNTDKAFASDSRQQVKNFDPKTKSFELHVSASHGPLKGVDAEPAAGKEFLGSSFFINWDNLDVKAHAAKAVAGLGQNATAWDKARAIERWVNQNMKAFEFTQAMATADQVAKTLSGDCTEYALLAAAMCRAVGVPSRVAVGLVHAPGRDGKFYLAYHMWTEVYADGQWLPIDATLGMGGVGPGHVKISDSSWHDERSIAPLLPMLRVLMAKPSVEVVKVGQ
jgi:transglutaminase-like putative cysteine protease